MINKDENALLIVKNFCKAFYQDRNIDETFSFLSNEIVWTGPNKKAEIASYEKLRAIFLVDISLIKSPFIISPISNLIFKVTEDVYNINYSFKIDNKKKNINLKINLFATVLYKKSIGKIVSAKFDYIDKPDFTTNTLSQHAQGGLMVVKYVNNNYYSIDLINEQFSSLFKLTAKESENIITTNLFDYFQEADIEMVKHLFQNNKNSKNPFSYNCKIKRHNEDINVIALVTVKKEKDEIKYYIISRPITNIDKNTILPQINKNISTKDSFITGTHRNKVDPIFSIEDVSYDFCKFLGYKKNELIKATHNDFRKLIHQDDLAYFNKTYSKLTQNRPKNALSYRLLNIKGESLWINENIELTIDSNGDKHIFSIVSELENLNRNAKSLDENVDQSLASSIESKFLIVDLVNNRFNTEVFEKSPIKFKTKYIENIPNSLIENNIIYEEDIKGFLTFCKNIQAKQQNEWRGRLHLKNNKIGWYHIFSYTLFNNNMPIKALCILINISSHKKMIEKFNKRQEIVDFIISDYEFFGEYDLLNHEPIFMYAPDAPKDFYENKKVDNFEFCLNNILHTDDVEKLIELRDLNLTYALNNQLPENIEFDIRYRSLTNKFEGFRWCKVTYIYKLDKDTNHLHLILTIKNIDKEKRNELALLHNIANNN